MQFDPSFTIPKILNILIVLIFFLIDKGLNVLASELLIYDE